MSEMGEIGQALHVGVDTVREAMAPLEDGRAHAEWIIRDLHAKRLAVIAMIDFFRSLPHRVQREVRSPYATAQKGCLAGTKTITGALHGAENPQANDARGAVRALRSRAGELLDDVSLVRQSDDIEAIIEALNSARSCMEEVTDVMGGAEEIGSDIQNELYPSVVQRVMDYSENL